MSENGASRPEEGLENNAETVENGGESSSVDTEDISVKEVLPKLLEKMKLCPARPSDDEDSSGATYSPFYNMNHPRRGVAIIFNQKYFEESLGLDPRRGTGKDVKRLEAMFSKHGFDVKPYHNLSLQDIIHVINSRVLEKDHSDADCIAFAILTHGEEDDLLWAKDTKYRLHDLCMLLSAEKCPSLAGKPKLFFVQACKGKTYDHGSYISTDSAGQEGGDVNNNKYYKIPNHADFFLAYSTIPGFYAFRNTEKGSWFIQVLYKKLTDEESYNKSIFQIMTDVVGTVAFNFESDRGKYKQIPSFTSRLTKDLIFRKK